MQSGQEKDRKRAGANYIITCALGQHKKMNRVEYLGTEDRLGSKQRRQEQKKKNTIELLGFWESIYNPDFKPVEFQGFRKLEKLPR